MKPISTFGQTVLRNSQLRRLESDLAMATQELGSGKKSDVAKSLGAGLFNLQSLRNQFEENAAFLGSIDTFNQRTSLMDSAFKEVNGAIVDLLELASINGADALDSASTVRLTAESVIDRINNALNVSVGGRYLFSGDAVDARTLTPTDSLTPGGVTPNQIAQEVLTGTAPGALAGADLTAPVDAIEAEEVLDRFEAVFQPGATNNSVLYPTLPEENYSFELTIFNGEFGGNLTEIRLPPNLVQQQSNDEFVQGLRDVLQGAYMLMNVDIENIDDPAAYETLMTGGTTGKLGALDRVAQGLRTLQEVHADLGLRQQIVEASQDATRSSQ